MRFGEKYGVTLKGMGERIPIIVTYKRVECGEYRTDNQGNGIWKDGRQIRGTMQFSVAGCRTEKAARAKLRRFIKSYELP